MKVFAVEYCGVIIIRFRFFLKVFFLNFRIKEIIGIILYIESSDQEDY